MLFLSVAMGCAQGPSGDSASLDTSANKEARARTAAAPVDTQRVTLSVKGMYCASCESTVSAMLRRTSGVFATEVSVTRSEAVIMYDSTRTTPTTLVNVIGTLGYRATLKKS